MAISNPKVIQSGFWYMNDDSGPISPCPWPWNTTPNIRITTPRITTGITFFMIFPIDSPLKVNRIDNLADEIKISLDECKALVVRADNYYKDWKAKLDEGKGVSDSFCNFHDDCHAKDMFVKEHRCADYYPNDFHDPIFNMNPWCDQKINLNPLYIWLRKYQRQAWGDMAVE